MEPASQKPAIRKVAPPDVYAVAPALAEYTDRVLFGDVWERAELPRRDRSLITVAALVAGGHTAQMPGHFNRALDNGVEASEIAGIITHLAFYAGWPRAMSAIAVAKGIFAQRGVATEAEPGAPLPANVAAEAQRAASFEAQIGAVAPALVAYTNTVLFDDLWRRTDLTPRDRSLVTITALIGGGQVEQLSFHIERGLGNGLTETEISEAITHLAFYNGWPRAMSAIPVAKSVFEARQRS